MKNELLKYYNRLQELRKQLDEYDNDAEEKVLDIQNELYQNFDKSFMRHGEYQLYNKIIKEIEHIKKEYNFYDPEAELDWMFPNRYDDDFDEDSMSWDSVFGNH